MNKSLWVDILCLESILAARDICRKNAVDKIYYLNRACGVSDQMVRFGEKLTGRSIECVDWISASEEKIKGTTLFELIYFELVRSLDKLVERRDIVPEIERICKAYGFSPVKFREHLRESAVPHVFKPVEMLFFAKKVSGDAASLFLVRNTCFKDLLRETLGGERTYFYTTWFSHRFGLENRPQFHWDRLRNKEYVFDRVNFLLTGAIYWLRMGINALLAGRDVSKSGFRIGVDCIQSRVRLDRINDIYWLAGSGIDPQTVVGIEFEDYDEESVENLKNLGIRRYFYSRNPLKILRRLVSGRARDCGLIAARFQDWLKVSLLPLQFAASLGRWGLCQWIHYEEMNFRFRVTFWESVYRQLGIRMLWSMYDYDPDKLAKAQALEKIDGLFMGSHWTNYQMAAIANERKVYDVFFPWGEHFAKNIYTRYPFIAVFPVGYSLDYYFAAKRAGAAELRAKYPGKFILSYHDNVCSHDFTYSYETENKLYRMLFALLEKYDRLVVFLKPKRIDLFEQARKNFPQIDRYLQQGRMEVFAGETPRTRAVPAEIGMASDLAVGLGISTAAAECFFAGTVGYHADFPGFMDNPFVTVSRNKFVFTDESVLRAAIEARIEGRDRTTYKDFQKEHLDIDPFQDGKAAFRTGYAIAAIQKALAGGLNRTGAAEQALKEFEARFSRDRFGITEKDQQLELISSAQKKD